MAAGTTITTTRSLAVTRDERIRRLAFQLWEGAGRPAGEQENHWRLAEAEIDAADAAAALKDEAFPK